MSSEATLSVESGISLLLPFRSIKEPIMSPSPLSTSNLAPLAFAYVEITTTKEENLTSSLNLLEAYPFEIDFDVSVLKERILAAASCDSSINRMHFDTLVADYETTNDFSLNDDYATISSSFENLIPLKSRANSSPFKRSPALNFQDLELEFSDYSKSTFGPSAIVGIFLTTSPPNSNDPYLLGRNSPIEYQLLVLKS